MCFVIATAGTDQATAIAAVAAAAIALIGVLVGWSQLSGLRKELRISGLMAVLEIESQMSDRKVGLDKLVREVEELEAKKDAASEIEKKSIQEQLNRVRPFFESACESYLNAVDRLCYCILHEYLADRDWRTEYRDHILQTIRAYQPYFNTGSAFKNTINLNTKWQAS